MRRITLLAILIVTGAASIAARHGQGPGQPEVLEIEKVKDNLFIIKNGGGNAGVFVTANGVVVVDTKNPTYGARSSTRSARSPTSR
jgi:hypothetical protein